MNFFEIFTRIGSYLTDEYQDIDFLLTIIFEGISLKSKEEIRSHILKYPTLFQTSINEEHLLVRWAFLDSPQRLVGYKELNNYKLHFETGTVGYQFPTVEKKASPPTKVIISKDDVKFVLDTNLPQAENKATNAASSLDSQRGLGYNTENIKPILPQGQKHLFVIGIDNYQHLRRLNNAVKDIEAIVEVLLNRYDFDKAHLKVLKNEEATRENIIDTLHHYTKKSVLSENDSLLIYFAGHGILDEDEEGYWVPVESRRESISSFIPNQIVIGQIKNMKCRHVLLISDSCFSGSLLVSDRDESIYSKVATELDSKKSRWVITSGGRDEKVQDGIGNSPFATAILSELQHNNKPHLITDELAFHIRHITRANSPQHSLSGRLYGAGDALGQFVFTLRDNEARDWQSAMAKNTIAEYRNFILQYPKSTYQVIAENKLEVLAEYEAWRSACHVNTKTAYLSFLKTYPYSVYKTEANQKIEGFTSDQPQTSFHWRLSEIKVNILNFLKRSSLIRTCHRLLSSFLQFLLANNYFQNIAVILWITGFLLKFIYERHLPELNDYLRSFYLPVGVLLIHDVPRPLFDLMGLSASVMISMSVFVFFASIPKNYIARTAILVWGTFVISLAVYNDKNGKDFLNLVHYSTRISFFENHPSVGIVVNEQLILNSYLSYWLTVVITIKTAQLCNRYIVKKIFKAN